MGLPDFPIFSILRRGAGRTGEAGVLFHFLDLIGIAPGFTEAIAVPNTAIGAVLTCMAASALFDLFQSAVSPDMSLPCEDDDPQLPLE